MSKVISIAIRKGGVGKTTSAVNIATALHLKGYKTLLIDLEHTANATISVGIDPYSVKTSLADLFTSLDRCRSYQRRIPVSDPMGGNWHFTGDRI